MMTEKASGAEQKESPNVGGNKVLPANAQRPPGDIRRRGKAKQRTGPFVKYVGAAASRSITPAAWKSLGIPLQADDATHVWSAANDKMIESSNFSDDQLDYLLIDDLQPGTNVHSFLEVDFNKDGQLEQVEQETLK